MAPWPDLDLYLKGEGGEDEHGDYTDDWGARSVRGPASRGFGYQGLKSAVPR